MRVIEISKKDFVVSSWYDAIVAYLHEVKIGAAPNGARIKSEVSEELLESYTDWWSEAIEVGQYFLVTCFDDPFCMKYTSLLDGYVYFRQIEVAKEAESV
jgi:hypothetical protein